jgi:hypothetical protein
MALCGICISHRLMQIELKNSFLKSALFLKINYGISYELLLNSRQFFFTSFLFCLLILAEVARGGASLENLSRDNQHAGITNLTHPMSSGSVLPSVAE